MNVRTLEALLLNLRELDEIDDESTVYIYETDPDGAEAKVAVEACTVELRDGMSVVIR